MKDQTLHNTLFLRANNGIITAMLEQFAMIKAAPSSTKSGAAVSVERKRVRESEEATAASARVVRQRLGDATGTTGESPAAAAPAGAVAGSGPAASQGSDDEGEAQLEFE